MNIEDPNFNPGAIVDRVDTRDFQWSTIGKSSAPFDWNAGFDIETIVGTLPVKDQNGSYSCGGQAWATLAAVLEAVQTGKLEERSAKFIYSQTYQQGGGSSGRDNANIFIKQGAARETVLTSYDNGTPPAEPFMERSGDITATARADAATDKAYAYATVAFDFDTLAQAIRDNHGVIIGLYGQNNGTWNSPYPLPPTQNVWAHWIYAGKAKLINGKKYIGLLNSWGTAVGEQGWQWIEEGYVPAIWAAWTHVLASNLPYKFNTDFGFGATGEDVTQLQARLGVVQLGIFGPLTRAAVKGYQSAHQIPNIGFVGPLTRACLNSTV